MKKIWKLFLLIIVALIVGIFIYLNTGQYGPSNEAILLSDEYAITKVNDNYQSTNSSSKVGLIMYTGAKVDPLAYSYLARTNANLYIVNSPFNMPVFSTKEAQKIMDSNPTIENWYIMGHSLGGVVAFMYENNPKVSGVISLASYPSSDESTQLMGTNILAIFANEDGLVDKEKYDTLPIGTNKVLIPGNHAGFGDYGIQKGDNKSSISINEQHDQIIKEIEEFIQEDSR